MNVLVYEVRHFQMFLLQEKALPLHEIMTRLERVYCGSIGAEFMHIPDIDQVTKRGIKPGVDFINCFAPYTYLLLIAPVKSFSKVGRRAQIVCGAWHKSVFEPAPLAQIVPKNELII